MMIVTISFSYAYADDSKIPMMSHNQREQIFSKVPNFQGQTVNYFFQIIITPTGVKETNVVLNQINYTALKNDVGFFTACGDFNNGLCEPPTVTQSQPTTNFCPLAKMILENQDGYLYKLYNASKGLDLTNMMYPSYCYAETGANPINGNNLVPIPEFSPYLILIVPIGFAVLISTWWMKFTGKKA